MKEVIDNNPSTKENSNDICADNNVYVNYKSSEAALNNSLTYANDDNFISLNAPNTNIDENNAKSITFNNETIKDTCSHDTDDVQKVTKNPIDNPIKYNSCNKKAVLAETVDNPLNGVNIVEKECKRCKKDCIVCSEKYDCEQFKNENYTLWHMFAEEKIKSDKAPFDKKKFFSFCLCLIAFMGITFGLFYIAITLLN